MTKNKDSIFKYEDSILLRLLESPKTLNELVKMVHLREKESKYHLIFYCPVCSKENRKWNNKKNKNIIIETNKENETIIILNQNIKNKPRKDYSVPEWKCQDCGKRILKYNKNLELLTKYEIIHLFEIPYEKKKYLEPNLKRTKLSSLEERKLIKELNGKYVLNKKNFYTYVFDKLINKLRIEFKDKEDYSKILGNNVLIGDILIKEFYENFRWGRFESINQLVEGIMYSLSMIPPNNFKKIIEEGKLKKLKKKEREYLSNFKGIATTFIGMRHEVMKDSMIKSLESIQKKQKPK